MKKAIQRILTALLAACLLLGGTLGASAAAKNFGADLTIRRMPTDTTFVPGMTEPDLSGLELAFKLGGVEKTLRYDDLENSWDEENYDNIWLSFPDEETKIGKNTFTLEVHITSGKESYTRTGLPIVFTGVPLGEKVDLTQVKALKAGLPNKVDPVMIYSGEINLYSFTPKVDGRYSFRSSFSSRPRVPSFEDLANTLIYNNLLNLPELFRTRIDPIGKLFDEQGAWIAEGDDQTALIGSRINLDFCFDARLEAGKTYYFLPGHFGDEAPYVVTPMFRAF